MNTIKTFITISLCSILLTSTSKAESLSDENKVTYAKLLNFQEFKKGIEYPLECRRMGIEGKVLIKFELDKEGRIANYQFLGNSHKLLKQACQKDVDKLRFMPTIDAENHKQPSFIILPIKFKLH